MEVPHCLGLTYLELGIQTVGAQISFLQLLAMNLWGNASVPLCLTAGPEEQLWAPQGAMCAPDQEHN